MNVGINTDYRWTWERAQWKKIPETAPPPEKANRKW